MPIGRFVAPCAAALLALALLVPPVATAQLPFDRAPTRPMRITGYWDRDPNDPAVLGVLTVSDTAGTTTRRFAVTAVQAYAPEEEGMQVFRASGLQRTNLRLLGDAGVVARMMRAGPREKVTAFGQYTGGSGTFVLGTVELGEGPTPPAG